MKDYEEAVDCDRCDLAAVRIFTAPVMVKVACDVRYDSPVDGRPITSHAARQEDLKRHGAIPYDPEMKKDAERRQREITATMEKSIDETVAVEVAKLSPKKREQLVQEVVNQGMTAESTRMELAQ